MAIFFQVRGRRERASNFPLLDDSLVSMIINDAQARLVTSTASPQTSRQSSQNSANRLRVVPMNRVSFEPNLPRMSNRSGHLLNCTPGTSDTPSVLVSLSTHEARALKGHSVSSKSPLRVRYGNEGVVWRNRKKCFPDKGSLILY